jgi:hypothetical protein
MHTLPVRYHLFQKELDAGCHVFHILTVEIGGNLQRNSECLWATFHWATCIEGTELIVYIQDEGGRAINVVWITERVWLKGVPREIVDPSS